MKTKILYLFFILIFVVTLAVINFGASSPEKFNLSNEGITNPIPGFINFTPSWSTGLPLPVATCNGGGASYTRNDTGWIYTIGGTTSTGLTANVRRYNVNTNTWSDMIPLFTPLEYFAAATLNNYIYIIGGYNGTNCLNSFYKYDINLNSWTTTGINFPLAAADCKAVGYQDSLIYVAGGYTTTAINNVYLYNRYSNTFRAATSLPAARQDGAFSRSGDTLVYVGGLTTGSVVTATTYKGLISQTDKSSITWTTGLDYPGGAREGWDAANWGSYGIIVVGGWNGTGYTNTCSRYSPGTNTWTSMPTKTTSEYEAFVGSVYVGNNFWKLVVAGGENGSNLTATEILIDSIFTLHDVSTQSIDIPCIQPGNYIPKATFYNNGHVSETFNVSMVIGTYTSTKAVSNLASGASQQISFDSWNAIAGQFTVKAYTQLSGDMNHSNDTLYKSILVTTQFWTYGVHNIYGVYDGTGVGYTRNDTGWVFSIGGNINFPNYINTVTKYNVNNNLWTTVSPLPASFGQCASALLKDSIYVIGGRNNVSWINSVYKYDINANMWTSKTNYPVSLFCCKAVGYQDSLIYVAGGSNGSLPINDVNLYNSNTNSWRPATSLPAIRQAGAFSRIGDTLIYIGGYDGSSDVATTYKGVINQTNRCVITWTQGADYPAGTILFFDAATWGNLGIITVGGYNNQVIYKNCYVYSPGANVWTQHPDKPKAECSASIGSVYVGNNTWKFIATSGFDPMTILDTTEIWTEIIPTAPSIAPVLVCPVNNSTNVSTTPIMSWTAVSNATNYRIQISTDSLFGTTNFDSLTISNALNVPAGKLLGLTKYYWRVRGTNTSGAGPWSSVWNFTTGNSGIKQTSSVIPKSFQLFQNYPNPFNPETKIRFDIPPLNPPLSKGGRGLALRGVSLKIYDITGREITTLVNESLQPGNYEITFDGSNLSSGIYFYKLIAGDFISIKKMLLIK